METVRRWPEEEEVVRTMQSLGGGEEGGAPIEEVDEGGRGVEQEVREIRAKGFGKGGRECNTEGGADASVASAVGEGEAGGDKGEDIHDVLPIRRRHLNWG